ncbi:MAG: hypothetical protein AAGA06_11070 [Pseudomonadota bacterium]
MPILILILTAVGGAIWWWMRSNPREALDMAADAATTVRNAPRKLAFRRQTQEHPVEGIDDPRIALCGIAQAFIELDDLPTKDQRDQLHVDLRRKLRVTEEESEELETLGRWLVTQCNGAEAAIPRLARRLYKIDGAASWNQLQDILMGLAQDELSASQVSAIGELKTALKR